MRRFRHVASERGTSVIEILVVMVILLVGIMSIVRLFPGGFAAVRHAESITFANRMAQAELERLKTFDENIPAGILPIDPKEDIWNNVHPGPPYKDADSGSFDNIDTFRRVMGETTKIPVGTYFGDAYQVDFGSVYSLIFSPIAQNSVGVYGGTWRRRLADDDSSRPRLRSFEYGVYYGSGTSRDFKICFRPASYNRTFRVSFSWWESDTADSTTQLKSAVSEVVVPVNSGDWITVSIPTVGAAFHGIEEYSDSVARAFNQVVTWSEDVYEYKVVDYDTGVIAFNPRGHNAVEYTVDGTSVLEAHVDYVIHNLKIIHEDRIVPADLAGQQYRVKLSLRYIKQAGVSIEFNGNTYSGFDLPSGRQKDLVLLDLNSGWRIKYPQPAIEFDYKEGALGFAATVEMEDPSSSATAVVPIAGRNIRIFYQAEGDWRVLVHKSYELYREGGSADYCHYVHWEDSPRLEFAACDIGKNVTIDYTYHGADQLDPGQTIEHRVVGETHQIQESGNARNGYIGYVDLGNIPSRITAVYGTSLKARVIWVEGGRLGKPRYQWIDADTTLTRKPYEI